MISWPCVFSFPTAPNVAFLLGVWPHFLGNSWSCQWCEVQKELWKIWRQPSLQQWLVILLQRWRFGVYQAFPPINHYILCTAQTCQNAVRVTESSPFVQTPQGHPIPASSWIAAAPAASFCKHSKVAILLVGNEAMSLMTSNYMQRLCTNMYCNRIYSCNCIHTYT